MPKRDEIMRQLSVAEQALVLALEHGLPEDKALKSAGLKQLPRGKRGQRVQAALDAKPSPVEQSAAGKRFEVTEDAIMQRLAAVAFVDPRECFDADGKLLDFHELPAHVAVAVKQIDMSVVRGKKNDEHRVVDVSYKFHSMLEALQLLGKSRSINMFIEKVGTDKDDPLLKLLEAIGNRNVDKGPLPSGQ